MTDKDNGDGLKALRDELDTVDARLVELAALRQQLVSKIGRFKQTDGRQLRDFKREREVLNRVRARAGEVGLDPVLAEDLLKRLIDASLTRQEQERIRHAGRGDGRRALVIGGAGRMGGWLAAFLDNQGYDVVLADPALDSARNNRFSDWREAPLDAPVIAVATSLRASTGIIADLTERRVPGLVFDVGSLKAPLSAQLREAAAAGLKICSIHPMFGPDTQLLSGRHVLLMDVGSPAAVNEARALFDETMAEVVELPLDEHDRMMALVLGLSHALNIAFFTALASAGVEAEQLAGVSSTTFKRQLDIATDMADENPELYFEIQHLNPHGEIARQALSEAIETVIRCAANPDPAGFIELMHRGRAYLKKMNA